MSKLHFIDLFCGAGLFSSGFAAAGFRPALALDLDASAIATYNKNLADVAIVRSATEQRLGVKADVLLAGPPCQGFSTLGRQDPRDERNRLCMVIPKRAEECNAKVVVVENVPPFVQSSSWRRMALAFKRQGYSLDTWILNAASYGTPQIRSRAFTIASKIGQITQPKATNTVVASSSAVFQKIPRRDPMHVWPQPSELALARFEAIPILGDKRDLIRAAPHLCPPSWYRMGIQEATDVWGRIDSDKPANTLRCRFQNPSMGRYIHPTENRVISLREGARIQGVNDSWQFVGKREAIARQIGNGVPVPLAFAVARAIKKALGAAGSDVRSAA